MNRLLIAIALTAALSMPAIAMPSAAPDRYGHAKFDRHQKQSHAGNSQTWDPYWRRCSYFSYRNSCE
jgi:hypothetical protein